jgi:hypothetical protein
MMMLYKLPTVFSDDRNINFSAELFPGGISLISRKLEPYWLTETKKTVYEYVCRKFRSDSKVLAYFRVYETLIFNVDLKCLKQVQI